MKLSIITSSIVALSAVTSAAPFYQGTGPADLRSPVHVLKRAPEPAVSRASFFSGGRGKRSPEPEPAVSRASFFSGGRGKRSPEPEPAVSRASFFSGGRGKRSPEPEPAVSRASFFSGGRGKRSPEPEPAVSRASFFSGGRGKRDVSEPIIEAEVEKRGHGGNKYSGWDRFASPSNDRYPVVNTQQLNAGGNDDMKVNQQEQDLDVDFDSATPPQAAAEATGANAATISVNDVEMQVPIGELITVDGFKGRVMKMTTDAGYCMAMAKSANGEINFIPVGPGMSFDATLESVEPNVATELLAWCQQAPFDEEALDALA